MSLRAKLVTTIAALCMVICLLSVGVWAASQGTVGLNGTVSFQLKDVQVDVAGAIKGATGEENKGSADEATIVTEGANADVAIVSWDADSEASAGDNTTALSTTWEIGALNFADKNSEIVIVVKVKNNNPDNAVNATFAPTVGGQALTADYAEVTKTEGEDTVSLNVEAKMSTTETIAVGATGIYKVFIKIHDKNLKVTTVNVGGTLTLQDAVAHPAA